MKPRPSKHRSRRLRKKLHLDEFQTMGFELEFTIKSDLDHGAADALFDAFIDQAVEANALYCGGGGRPHYHFFVEKGDKSVSEEERDLVVKWLSSRDDVEKFTVSPLIDSWYPDDEAV